MLYKVTWVFLLITKVEKVFCNSIKIKQTSQNKKKGLLYFFLFYWEVIAAGFNNRRDFSGDGRNEKCEQLRTPDHWEDIWDRELD